jgi:hypothetical protein
MIDGFDGWFRLEEALARAGGVSLVPRALWTFAGPLYHFEAPTNDVGVPVLEAARLVRSYDVRVLRRRGPSRQLLPGLAVVVVAGTSRHGHRPILFPALDARSVSLLDEWWEFHPGMLKTLQPTSDDGGKTVGVRVVGNGLTLQGADHRLDFVERRALFALDTVFPDETPVHGLPPRRRDPRRSR